MHLVTILAYACLFWRAAGPIIPSRVIDGAWGTLAAAVSPPFILWLAARWVSRRTLRLVREAGPSHAPQHFYHRATLALRVLLLAAFVGSVFATAWPDWMTFGRVAPELQIFGDLIVLSPFFAGAIAIWLGTFAVEGAIRDPGRGIMPDAALDAPGWRLGTYLDFNLRHHLLAVALPMTLILFAANVTQGREQGLREWTGWTWAPDAMLAAAAAVVFALSPVLLRRVWKTATLPPGRLRLELESLCGRIGLRVRDILVWNSDGLMINAAVMGVLPPLRYVLLSDALLATMTPRQIEAVFGHEAGHVRHHHILHFLVFALVGWIATAAVMEFVARIVILSQADPGPWIPAVQLIGVGVTLLFWGVGFGWLSRRFERQADAFAARCAAPPSRECNLPCSVHLDESDVAKDHDRVCSSGAAIFASALDRVASLNGIPRDEPSWRHSSIAGRIRFLTSLAADPARARRFERRLRRVKVGMLTAAALGSAAWIFYWLAGLGPAILQMQAANR